jgi:hypothetical protein
MKVKNWFAKRTGFSLIRMIFSKVLLRKTFRILCMIGILCVLAVAAYVLKVYTVLETDYNLKADKLISISMENCKLYILEKKHMDLGIVFAEVSVPGKIKPFFPLLFP